MKNFLGVSQWLSVSMATVTEQIQKQGNIPEEKRREEYPPPPPLSLKALRVSYRVVSMKTSCAEQWVMSSGRREEPPVGCKAPPKMSQAGKIESLPSKIRNAL